MADEGGVTPTDLDASLAAARDAIKALRKAPPNESPAAARQRSCRLVEAQRALVATSRRVVSDAVTARHPTTNGFGSDPPPAFMKPTGSKQGRGLTEGQVAALVKGLAKGLVPWVKEVLAEATTPLAARIAALEGKPPSLPYEGTWSESKAYARGALVTHAGSLWHCEDGNVGVRPGTGSAWKLAVKRGKGG